MKIKNYHIAVFEDDQLLITNITWKLKHLGTITPSSDLSTSLKILHELKFDLAIIDLHFDTNDFSGKKLISACKKLNIPVIVISSDERSEIIEELYALGANHFLRKNDFLDLLEFYATQLLRTMDKDYFSRFFNTKFLTQNTELQNEIKKLWLFPIKGESVHITGPTGAGKSLLAQLFHEEIYGKAPFIHLNCAEIPENLLESELFGHVKGAFTHAEKSHQGKISLAHNGTLFLDEIGCLNLSLQAKLLKVLETKCFYPVGSNELVKSNFTLISATWENLLEKTKSNQFRLDLYQRIIHLKLNIPALKNRPEDINLYITQWMKNYPRRFTLTEDAKNILLKSELPGNFRELKSVLTRIAQTDNGVVNINDLKNALDNQHITSPSNFLFDYDHVKKVGMKNFLKELEKKIVEKACEQNQGQVTAAMQELKLSPSSFYRISQHL